MKSKICGICSQEKSIKDFYKRKYGSKDGLHGHCKECQKDMSRDWTKNNMDRHSQYTSKWNSENADKMRKHKTNEEFLDSINKKPNGAPAQTTQF